MTDSTATATTTAKQNSKSGEERFNNKNPPPSLAVARLRLDAVETTVHRIEVRLEFDTADDFPSEDAYQGWRKSAEGALAYWRQEKGFLTRWISKEEYRTKNEEARNRPKAKNILDIRPDAQPSANATAVLEAIAEAIATANYSVLYSKKNPPPDLETAQKRRNSLADTYTALNSALAEINRKCAAVEDGFKRKVNSAKSHFGPLMGSMTSELSYLREYIRATTPPSASNDWKKVCIGMFEKARAAGVILDSDEERVYRDMLKQRETQAQG